MHLRWACHFSFSRASWENNAEHELGKNEDRPEFVKINRNPYGQTGTHICVIISDFDKLGGLQKELELSPRKLYMQLAQSLERLSGRYDGN